MKFLVSDCQEDRHNKIRKYLQRDTAIIAALLAAVDFEWTIRRVLDRAANEDKKQLEPPKISRLDQYSKEWSKIFCAPGSKSLSKVVGDWNELRSAYQIRHDIVHGRQGSSGVNYAATRVNRILAASKAVADYGRQCGADPYRRIRRAILTGPTRKKRLEK